LLSSFFAFFFFAFILAFILAFTLAISLGHLIDSSSELDKNLAKFLSIDMINLAFSFSIFKAFKSLSQFSPHSFSQSISSLLRHALTKSLLLTFFKAINLFKGLFVDMLNLALALVFIIAFTFNINLSKLMSLYKSINIS
jgi:hypothetical protein